MSPWKLVGALLAFAIAVLGSYLLGAFVAWSFDPSEWNWLARLAAGLVAARVAYVVLTEDYSDT